MCAPRYIDGGCWATWGHGFLFQSVVPHFGLRLLGLLAMTLPTEQPQWSIKTFLVFANCSFDLKINWEWHIMTMLFFCAWFSASSIDLTLTSCVIFDGQFRVTSYGYSSVAEYLWVSLFFQELILVIALEVYLGNWWHSKEKSTSS